MAATVSLIRFSIFSPKAFSSSALGSFSGRGLWLRMAEYCRMRMSTEPRPERRLFRGLRVGWAVASWVPKLTRL